MVLECNMTNTHEIYKNRMFSEILWHRDVHPMPLMGFAVWDLLYGICLGYSQVSQLLVQVLFCPLTTVTSGPQPHSPQICPPFRHRIFWAKHQT